MCPYYRGSQCVTVNPFRVHEELPFEILLSREYTGDFPRGYMTCNITKDWIEKQMWESRWLLLSRTLKGFVNMQSKPLFSFIWFLWFWKVYLFFTEILCYQLWFYNCYFKLLINRYLLFSALISNMAILTLKNSHQQNLVETLNYFISLTEV